jgi:hypothetical protein
VKKYTIALIVLLCCHLSASSNIINGYLREKLIFEKEIKKSAELLKEVIKHKDSIQIEKKLKKLRREYASICLKYLETEKLISEISIIDPVLYDTVSKVTNAEGTLTHVYVRYTNPNSKEIKYLTEQQFKASGYTCVLQDKNNEHVCSSFFGTNTISIVICKGCDEKLVLAHEFGHVLYIVPNLKEYIDFSENPNGFISAKSHTGHSSFDPSNPMVNSVEKRFKNKYRGYLERLNNDSFDQQILTTDHSNH